ncbi:beta-1,4-N-acetylgalactosaminyltransferase bre-4-like [Octopus vulgaris]|uniref:Beta-1,4-N-acetylgalactosaminyltransferase bre-4-like n=1 Tax=Octopus vulgaris TaxID=6645 RepID=A0AA36FGS2_OCTVU|nr:beta-1,4-N-acetylgalactosaminyltransferase bre-4-like [Octopus vulgaris]
MLARLQRASILLLVIVAFVICYQSIMVGNPIINYYLGTNNTQLRLNLSACLKNSRKLVGLQPIKKEILSWSRLNKIHSNVLLGGHYKPNCLTKESVAIIIPYRDRQFHLKVFLNNMHSILQRQLIEYGIYIIEQSDSLAFNRGMLMNVGFAESLKLYNYSCFIFHDIDLIPDNDKNIYDCEETPRHMSVAVDKMKYKLPYNTLFGGVVAMKKEEFRKVNGFSNRYFGWGGEDDDLYNRLPYNTLFGGVVAMKKEEFRKVNGFSNRILVGRHSIYNL